MKYRSLPTLFILNLITFGLYEYKWLQQINLGISKTYGLQPPKIDRLVLTRLLGLVSALVLLSVVMFAIPHFNKQLDAIHAPDQSCSQTFDQTSGQLNNACTSSYSNYYAKQDVVTHRIIFALGVVAVCIVLMATSQYYYSKWYQHFAQIIKQVLGNDIAPMKTLLFNVYNTPGLSMIMIQNAFNQNIKGINIDGTKYGRELLVYGLASLVLSFLAGVIFYLVFTG